MHNISHFRSVSMLPLMIFFNIKIYFRSQKFFLFSTFVFVFDNFFFNFQRLFPNFFIAIFNFWICLNCWRFFNFVDLPLFSEASFTKNPALFSLDENHFFENMNFLYLFIVFPYLAGCFHFGGISFTFWKFFRVPNSMFISGCFCVLSKAVFFKFQITFSFLWIFIFTSWIFLFLLTLSSN